MARKTHQMDAWSGEFGKAFTDRKAERFEEHDTSLVERFGLTRTDLNTEFIGHLDRSIRILEVGTNIGQQLKGLQEMGFQNLYGIELQHYAVELAKQKTERINIIQGDAFDIPFKDQFFDLVFTTGVLIHISPQDIGEALKEIHRCAKTHIWGFEYFAETYTEVNYRGNEDLLWKTDFAKLYLESFDNLKLVKERKLKYQNEDNVDSMFLLAKEA